MTRNLAEEARAAAKACDEIGCYKTAESLRAFAIEIDQWKVRNTLRNGQATKQEENAL